MNVEEIVNEITKSADVNKNLWLDEKVFSRSMPQSGDDIQLSKAKILEIGR